MNGQYQRVFLLLISAVIAGHIYIPEPLIAVYVFPYAANPHIFGQAGTAQVTIAITAPARETLEEGDGLHAKRLDTLLANGIGRSVPELTDSLLIDKVLAAISFLQVNMGEGVGQAIVIGAECLTDIIGHRLGIIFAIDQYARQRNVLFGQVRQCFPAK